MDLKKKKCVPCEGGIEPMPEMEEERHIELVPGWSLDRHKIHKIKRDFQFRDFKEAITFVNKAADLAEEEGHHPDICIHYNQITMELFTHAISGLHENDFIMAAKMNELYD